MKRQHAAAIGAVLLLVAAVAGTASARTGGSIDGLVYGIPSPLATEPGEHNINSGIECWADAHKGKVIVLDSNLDVNKQVTDFDSLLAQGAKVLPFVALDPKAFNGPFGRAKAKGATVVELYNPKTTARGRYLRAEPAGGHGRRETHRQGVSERLEGPRDRWAPDPGCDRADQGLHEPGQEVQDHDPPAQDNLKDNVNDARKLADDLLTKHPDAQVVFGFNDNSAIGAGLAAKSRGKKLMIFGINGTEQGINAVKSGLITATYEADQFKMGYLGAKLGAQLNAGQKVSRLVGVDMVRWDKASLAKWVPFSKRCASMK